MPRYAMTIDLSLCVGCAACAVACKMENQVPPGVHRLWIRERELGVFPDLTVEFRPEQCLLCANPPCVPVCPTGASYQTEDGLVLVDSRKCIACGACVAACPYEARYLHPAGYVDKCTFCQHRLEKGRLPACVETCPTGCRAFGDLDDPESPVAKVPKGGGKGRCLKARAGHQAQALLPQRPFQEGAHPGKRGAP